MADKRIEDATPDTNITGVEKLPVSDAGVAKCATIGQVKDFTVAQIAAIAAASGVNLDTDGVYILKEGAIKPVDADTLATAVLDYGFGKASVAAINGNEVVGVKDSTTQKTITVNSLKTWLEGNMTVSATLDIGSLVSAGVVADADVMVIAQSGTNKKITILNCATYAHVKFGEYVGTLTEATTLADTDIFYIINGTQAKKCSMATLRTMYGGGDVTGPASTTEGKVPAWDSEQKKLTDGFEVTTTIRNSPLNTAIPTEAAVGATLSGKVDKVTGKGLSTEDYTTSEKIKLAGLSNSVVMTGATAQTDGAQGLAPKPMAADVEKFLKGNGTWSAIPTMGGATASTGGTAGLVPSSLSGANTKFLRGDGTWQEVSGGSVSDMIGATASSAGTHGLVPAPAAGEQDKFLKGNGTWATVSGGSVADMTGATASAPGAHGLVPAPSAGDQNKVLFGDGTWTSLDSSSLEMTGATAGANGHRGFVPAPSAGDQNKYLRGDGTWGVASGSGTGDVIGPSSTTSGKIPQWSSSVKTLTDGLSVVTGLASTVSNSDVPTAKAVYDYITEIISEIESSVVTTSTSGLAIEVVTAMPASPEANTIYFVTES